MIFYSGATSSARAMSGGGKESEGEVDRVKDTEGNVYSKTSHSHSVGVTNENGGSIDLEEVSTDTRELQSWGILLFLFFIICYIL